MAATLCSDIDEVRRPDIVILGAGIAGLLTAHHFNRHGIRPLIVDRLRLPAGQTSRRSGEGVRAQWELPHNIEIARASIAFYRNLAEELGRDDASAGYRPVGYLYGSRQEVGAQLLEARVARQRAAGLDDVEFLHGEAALRRFPMLAPDTRGVAFRQSDGVIDVESVLPALLDSLDADLLLGVEANAISETAGGIALETGRGRIDAGTLVLANGARLAPTLRRLTAEFSLSVARATIVRLKVPGIPEDHPATIDVDAGSFWRPDTGGARLTATFRGNLLVEDGTDDPPLDRDYLDAALDSVGGLVPHWRQAASRIGDHHMRTGTFAITADGAPVIGPLPGYAHILVNGGYGGHGVMMSPDGARRLVQSYVSPGTEDPFLPARFSSGHPIQPEPMTVHLHGTSQE